MKHRPDLFVHTINNIRNGSAASDLSDSLPDCINAAKQSGKAATLTVKITVKPDSPNGKIFMVSEQSSVKLPEPSKAVTLMYSTDSGDLQRNDPDQHRLDLRSVEEEPKPIKKLEEHSLDHVKAN